MLSAARTGGVLPSLRALLSVLLVPLAPGEVDKR